MSGLKIVGWLLAIILIVGGLYGVGNSGFKDQGGDLTFSALVLAGGIILFLLMKFVFGKRKI